MLRIHKPIPIILLFSPVLWLLLTVATSPKIFWQWFFVLLLGSIAMRSAGCIINDWWDQEIDRNVARTKDRPLAARSLPTGVALYLLIGCLTISFACFLLLPYKAKIVALIALLGAACYPLAKRFFYIPQLVLGLVFNLGVLIAGYVLQSYIDSKILMLYIAAVAWTIGYDTVYALQDREEDAELGLYSLALNENCLQIIGQLYVVMIGFIVMSGILNGASYFFYALISIAAYILYWQVQTITDDNIPERFHSNAYVACLISIAFIIC